MGARKQACCERGAIFFSCNEQGAWRLMKIAWRPRAAAWQSGGWQARHPVSILYCLEVCLYPPVLRGVVGFVVNPGTPKDMHPGTSKADEHPSMRRFHRPGDEKRSVAVLKDKTGSGGWGRIARPRSSPTYRPLIRKSWWLVQVPRGHG